jgi:hypothetical protein
MRSNSCQRISYGNAKTSYSLEQRAAGFEPAHERSSAKAQSNAVKSDGNPFISVDAVSLDIIPIIANFASDTTEKDARNGKSSADSDSPRQRRPCS